MLALDLEFLLAFSDLKLLLMSSCFFSSREKILISLKDFSFITRFNNALPKLPVPPVTKRTPFIFKLELIFVCCLPSAIWPKLIESLG